MGITYRRSGEEAVKKCSCGTVWKDSWIDKDADKNRCPACHKLFTAQGDIRLISVKGKRKSPQRNDVKEPLARTEVQNYKDLLTARTTIKPQYNWSLIESIFPRERWSIKCKNNL